MHGGRIDAESGGLDTGAVFTLTLPVHAAAGDPAPAPCLPTTQRLLRILVVDDNADAAETLGLLLEQMGHAVRVVLDPTTALEQARAFQPELCLLDLGMPGLNGYDLARQLRAEPALRDVLLAALSGWGMEEHRARSRSAGIDVHLTKPVVLEDVNALLARAAARMPAATSG